jgi:hypothetical protein
MSRSGVALAVALAAAALPFAVLASAAFAGAGVTAVRMDPGRARPAESGAHDSAATLGPLAIGAAVSDSTGAPIGHVTRLTTGKDGRTIAEVRHDEDVYAIPVDELSARGGAAFSTVTLDQLRRDGAAH